MPCGKGVARVRTHSFGELPDHVEPGSHLKLLAVLRHEMVETQGTRIVPEYEGRTALMRLHPVHLHDARMADPVQREHLPPCCPLNAGADSLAEFRSTR